MRKFEKIHLYGVDRSGLNFEVHGIWDGQPFHLDMNVEVDGNTIDTKPLSSKSPYDPAPDDPDFFDMISQDERFVEANKAGYKVWELLGTIPE